MKSIIPHDCVAVFASFGPIVPFLNPVVATLVLIIQGVEETKDNRHQLVYLRDRCTALFNCVNKHYSEGKREETLRDLENLMRSLDHVAKCIQKVASKKNPFIRFIKRKDISAEVKQAHQELDHCVSLFELSTMASLSFSLDNHEKATQKDLAKIESMLEDIKELQENTLAASGTSTTSDWHVSSEDIVVESQVLGSGTSGTVYAGRWNGTKVAIKRVAKKISKKLLTDEIKIWRLMQHPHIASFYRACLDPEEPLLVFEIYQFGNMMEYMAGYPDANRVRLCYEIALGMTFLHKHEIVHGDLKPTKVLIDDVHRVRITDFGLSESRNSLVKETADEEAPAPVSISMDVYCFARSAFQIFTGEPPPIKRPEHRPKDKEVIDRGLSGGMWKVMWKCWAEKEERRYQFKEISQLLETLVKAQEAAARSTRRSIITDLGPASGLVHPPIQRNESEATLVGSPEESTRPVPRTRPYPPTTPSRASSSKTLVDGDESFSKADIFSPMLTSPLPIKRVGLMTPPETPEKLSKKRGADAADEDAIVETPSDRHRRKRPREVKA